MSVLGFESIGVWMPKRSNDATLAILGYHRIGAPYPGAWDTWYHVPEAVFLRHLAILEELGYEVIGCEPLERLLEGTLAPPARAAVITFDDGYRSVHDVALPALLRFGYHAILFVPTGFIGRSNAFDGGAEPEEPLCSWDQLHRLEQNGVSIQSHGVSHHRLSQLSPEEHENELVESKRALEKALGKAVRLFAYPYGDAGDDESLVARQLTAAGYRGACLYDGRLNRGPIGRPYHLHRLTMGPDTKLEVILDG